LPGVAGVPVGRQQLRLFFDAIKVSIPGPNANEDAKERLLNFGRTLENDEFDAETFTTILSASVN